MGRKFIDQQVLLEKLWAILKDESNKDMQAGIMQAILVATLIDTAETVERGDVPYGEDL